MAVHAVLLDTGATFEALKAAEHAEAFKRVAPAGAVPALVVDGKPLLEGAAILTYICEQEKSSLLPAGGWDRAQAMQWLAFANSTMHPRYGALFGHRKLLGDDAPNNPIYKSVEGRIQDAWNQVEAALEGRDFLVGQKPTVGDILLAVIANWTPRVSQSVVFGPRTAAYLKHVSQLPCFQKAMAAEQVEYKAV